MVSQLRPEYIPDISVANGTGSLQLHRSYLTVAPLSSRTQMVDKLSNFSSRTESEIMETVYEAVRVVLSRTAVQRFHGGEVSSWNMLHASLKTARRRPSDDVGRLGGIFFGRVYRTRRIAQAQARPNRWKLGSLRSNESVVCRWCADSSWTIRPEDDRRLFEGRTSVQ
jgi:hypothetical protein